VPATYTDGQAPQDLLANAVALSALGLDDSAVLAAVAATQAKLDADALNARQAQARAQAATDRASEARAAATAAQQQYASMAGAIKRAVVYLYTTGSASLTISPQAGMEAIYAEDYASSAISPYGVLAQRRALQVQRAAAMAAFRRDAQQSVSAAAEAARAVADQKHQLDVLEAELSGATGAQRAQVTADHLTLAAQVGQELLGAATLEFTPSQPTPAPLSTTPVALAWAFAELGKPYVWGATGPDSFDCSGLTQFVWKAAGVSIPRVAADQSSWSVPVPLSQLLPGDLVFFGTTDIHHVGIYIGKGLMINAPHTGTVVQVSSIWWSDLAGFGRVHDPAVPVPPHGPPTPTKPATPSVVMAAGPVPSQTAPPAGWTPGPGSTTPISVAGPSGGAGDTGAAPGVAETTLPPPTSTTTIAPSGTTTTVAGPDVPSPTTTTPSTVPDPGSTTSTAVPTP
jgi:cell wall-associated NlpC family hydrolase